jgi:hypothetical protein
VRLEICDIVKAPVSAEVIGSDHPDLGEAQVRAALSPRSCRVDLDANRS